MTLAEAIYQHSRNLPEAAAREALDFVQFLEQRYTQREQWFRGQVEQGLREANDAQTQWLSNEEVKAQSVARRAEWQAQAASQAKG
jgi:hypothetical protein